MRIAFISCEYPPDSCQGGIATYVWQTSHMMASRGHEVEVFTRSSTRTGRTQTQGVLVHWIQTPDSHDFCDFIGPVFAARHAENPFDVLEGPEYNADARKAVELVPDIPLVLKMHTPSFMAIKLNFTLRKRDRLKHIIKQIRQFTKSSLSRHQGDQDSTDHPLIQYAKKMELIESGHAQRATIVAPPCQDLCDFAHSAWNIPLERIRLAPHTYVPSEEFLKLESTTKRKVVGFVGRLEKRKGIEILAEAIPKVLNRIPDARFRLIGAAENHISGLPYDAWIEKRLSDHMDRIELTGKFPLDEMAQVYDSLDVCVFPSLWENFPNVCLEAMSAGRAIIASETGGMIEMLDHGLAGRLIPPGNSSALANEVISLLQSQEQRLFLGDQARKRVLETYNYAVIGTLMESIYQEAIAWGQPC